MKYAINLQSVHMKYCCLLLVLCTLVINSFGQAVKDSMTRQQSYNYYKTKEKNQRTAAGVLFVSGLIIQTVSFVAIINNLFGETPPGAAFGTIAGTTMLIGSIPLIIAADRNRKKAKQFKMVFEMQNSGLPEGMKIGKFITLLCL